MAKPETLSAENVGELEQEKEKTKDLFVKLWEAVPTTEPYNSHISYYTPTLKERLKQVPFGEKNGSLLRSAGSVLKNYDNDLMHVSLEKSRTRQNFVSIGWPHDVRLSVRIDWQSKAKTGLHIDNFTYYPSTEPFLFTDKTTPDLEAQTQANSVLEILIDDLGANKKGGLTNLKKSAMNILQNWKKQKEKELCGQSLAVLNDLGKLLKTKNICYLRQSKKRLRKKTQNPLYFIQLRSLRRSFRSSSLKLVMANITRQHIKARMNEMLNQK